VPEKEKNEENENELKAKGPMSKLFPTILSTMLQEKTEESQQGYIHALSDNQLHPSNLNLLHYFSFQNYSKNVVRALEDGMKYQRDKFGNTPLIYALARNSHQCVGALLNHAIHADNIVASMR
jgi:ankyrin repeat protein